MKIQYSFETITRTTQEVEVLRHAEIPSWILSRFEHTCSYCNSKIDQRYPSMVVVETKAGHFYFHTPCFKKAEERDK